MTMTMPSTPGEIAISMEPLQPQERSGSNSGRDHHRSPHDDETSSAAERLNNTASHVRASGTNEPDEKNPSGTENPQIRHTSGQSKGRGHGAGVLPGFRHKQAGNLGSRIYNYDEMFPKDEPGEELGPNARVWHVYLNEADLYDQDMVGGFWDSIDACLVFAALFSAVVTTFVVQTSQAFQPDYGWITAAATLELVALQRAMTNGTGPINVPSSGVTLDSVNYSSKDVWVNALWLASLSLSLGAALMSILVRQWLQDYTKIQSGTARDQAIRRQSHFAGVQRWKLSTFIGLIPIVLHLSLALFIAGLAIFAWSLLPPLSYIVIALASVTSLLYGGSILLAAIYEDCPYRIPILGDYISHLISPLRRLLHWGHFNNKAQISDALMWIYDCSSNPKVTQTAVQAWAGIKELHKNDPFLDVDIAVCSSSLLCSLIDMLHSSAECGNQADSSNYAYALEFIFGKLLDVENGLASNISSNISSVLRASTRNPLVNEENYFYRLLRAAIHADLLNTYPSLRMVLQKETLSLGSLALQLSLRSEESSVSRWLFDNGVEIDHEDVSDVVMRGLHLVAEIHPIVRPLIPIFRAGLRARGQIIPSVERSENNEALRERAESDALPQTQTAPVGSLSGSERRSAIGRGHSETGSIV